MSVCKNNEITLKINKELEDLIEVLENNGFEAKEHFVCDDVFFIPTYIDIKTMEIRKILEKAIIVRKVKKDKVLVFKKKEINKNGDILKQEKVECNILNIPDAKKFLTVIGYKEIMEIVEEDITYKKEDFEITVKNIKNGNSLIEIETSNKKGFETIDELKNKVLELNLPVDTSDFFVKKAEEELKKVIENTKIKKGS